MKLPAPFRDADERDELRWRIRCIMNARRDLAMVAAHSDLAVYRSNKVLSDLPALPSSFDLNQARELLHRAVFCLAHRNARRCRDADDVGLSEAIDDPDPVEAHNGTRF